MATQGKDITFIIPGQTQPAGVAAPATRGRALGIVKAPGRVTTRPGEYLVVPMDRKVV